MTKRRIEFDCIKLYAVRSDLGIQSMESGFVEFLALQRRLEDLLVELRVDLMEVQSHDARQVA
jgi:hypothetical protein